jgi:hypothetical protein
VSGQLHAPAALPPGKSPRYPFYRRLGRPQSRSGRYVEVKIFYSNSRPPPGCPARSQSLYRLSYPGSHANPEYVIILKLIGWGNMNWIDLAEDREVWRALVNTIWTFGFHKMLRGSWVGEQLAASQEVKLVSLKSAHCPKTFSMLSANVKLHQRQGRSKPRHLCRPKRQQIRPPPPRPRHNSKRISTFSKLRRN